MPETILVIPCFNEAQRLRSDLFGEYLDSDPETDLIFVDDGSHDGTAGILEELAARGQGRINVVTQPRNQGKAEAVRAGMNRAFSTGARFVGYFDADLATPLAEVSRLREVLRRDESIEIVFASRVQLLGRRIQRRPLRHYLGRVFATVASEVLGLPVYDTQCGAKLFRAGPRVKALFSEPFLSNWVFDVELIARWRVSERETGAPPAHEVIYEVPVDEWVDVAGSKVRPADFVRALAEIWRISRRYLPRKSRRSTPG
ncbi:MAG: glycosyltransferase [Myxococcota bacterium]|jgi:dolichyl-phosphate beta-glucosyltransferase|nr:glycosyltransferase [Myxococcota bacterium]